MCSFLLVSVQNIHTERDDLFVIISSRNVYHVDLDMFIVFVKSLHGVLTSEQRYLQNS